MKNEILKILKKNTDYFISGESISEDFNVSRSAVWKHINTLREEGYEIESQSRRGYKLINSPDILTYEEIEEYLKTEFIGRNIQYFESLSSTNIKAKEIAMEMPEGSIIISEEQTNGKGRLGRDWTSPKGKGIWMSIILKPDLEPTEVAKLTLIGAAAVHQGLEEMGINSKIKWPNDIIIENKKVCGILTEMSCELNIINYCIMGIGINVNLETEDFSEELKEKATSLRIIRGEEINRKILLANILNHFEKLYIPFRYIGDISKSIKISRENSILIGKDIRIIRGDTEKVGKALDIDEEGQLVVEMENGNIEKVYSGEVSVRGMKGYVDQ
ncbi:MAG: biotin--[acetyl-CoA-carboxylase] ligase [Tissierellia bacterium]|nr:biotin--[acetyl-CoA-carboxylase] ligase [Tissierellia bacterium]